MIPRIHAANLVQNQTKPASSTARDNDKDKGSGPAPLPPLESKSLAVRLFGTTLRPDTPRSSALHADISRLLPAPVFHRYERSMAAHNNCLENAPLFFSALILANFPGIGFGAIGGPAGVRAANALAAGYVLLRAAYIWAYVNSDGARSYLWMLRSACFHIGSFWCFGSIFVVAERLRKSQA